LTSTSDFLFIFIIRACHSSGLEFFEALLDGGEGALRGLQPAEKKNQREKEIKYTNQKIKKICIWRNNDAIQRHERDIEGATKSRTVLAN
jgi:hypothetical protein